MALPGPPHADGRAVEVRWGCYLRLAAAATLLLIPFVGLRKAAVESAAGPPGTGLHGAPLRFHVDAGAETPEALPSGERVVLRVEEDGDENYFADSHIILRRRRGRTFTYQSIPYESVRAFVLCTKGVWPDTTVRVELYTGLPSLPRVALSSQRSSRGRTANVYDVGRLITRKALGLEVPALEGVDFQPAPAPERRLGGGMTPALGRRIDVHKLEKDLRRSVALLGADEKVSMAFGDGGDTVLLTSRRIIRVVVRDRERSWVQYVSIPYEAVSAFQVQVEGTLTLHTYLRIWTVLPAVKDFQLAFVARGADIRRIQALMSDKILGVRAAAADAPAETGHSHPKDLFNWLDSTTHQQVDPHEAERVVRGFGMLQARGEERVLLAFPVGLHWVVRVLMTDKRLLILDGMLSRQLAYRTIPYSAIRAYSIETFGRNARDADLKIWTGIYPPAPLMPWPGGPIMPPKQCPTHAMGDECLSFISLDVRMMHGPNERFYMQEVRQLLDALVLGPGGAPPEPVPPRGVLARAEDHLRHARQHLGNGTDLGQVERSLKQGLVLREDETLQMAFEHGGALHVWSSKRFLLIELTGRFGRVRYQSFPYSTIKAFAVTSSTGILHADFELDLWTDIPWMPVYKQYFPRGHMDLWKVMMRVGVGLTSDRAPPVMLPQEHGWGTPFLWLNGSVRDTDVERASEEFHKEEPILLPGEHVLFACNFHSGTAILTSKRVVRVDSHGRSRKRYKSIPYTNVGSFLVHAHDGTHFNSRMVLHTTSHSDPALLQDACGTPADVFKLAGILTSGITGKP